MTNAPTTKQEMLDAIKQQDHLAAEKRAELFFRTFFNTFGFYPNPEEDRIGLPEPQFQIAGHWWRLNNDDVLCIQTPTEWRPIHKAHEVRYIYG